MHKAAVQGEPGTCANLARLATGRFQGAFESLIDGGETAAQYVAEMPARLYFCESPLDSKTNWQVTRIRDGDTQSLHVLFSRRPLLKYGRPPYRVSRQDFSAEERALAHPMIVAAALEITLIPTSSFLH